MQLLISDTNILIDIEDGNLTLYLFQLPYETIVPDVLFEFELKERHSHLLELGLKTKSLSPHFIQKIEDLILKYPKPSRIDHFALALSMQERCPLLTGDRDLQLAAKCEGIEVHGTLWIVEKLLHEKIIEKGQAKASFDRMKTKGSRLPWLLAEQLLNKTF